MASNTICKHANTHAAFNTSFLHRLVVVLMNGVGDILLRSLSTHHVNVAVVVEVKDTVAVGTRRRRSNSSSIWKVDSGGEPS